MSAMNLLDIEGYKPVILYDPEIEMFRGEFVGLTVGADFYARDIKGLRREGKASLKVFLDMCEEKGIEQAGYRFVDDILELTAQHILHFVDYSRLGPSDPECNDQRAAGTRTAWQWHHDSYSSAVGLPASSNARDALGHRKP